MDGRESIQFGGLTPYVYYEDAGKMADWLSRTFGFVEAGRHRGEDGRVQNVEMKVGPSEVWLDGYPGHGRRQDGPPEWIGVWVDSVDAMYERVKASGLDPDQKPATAISLTTALTPSRCLSEIGADPGSHSER